MFRVRSQPCRGTTGAAGAHSLGGRAFTLIEMVIAVVIIGIIAAIALPRLSRGGAAASEAAFEDNLSALRHAIEYYHAEHGKYPTCDEAGGNTTIMLQLTRYTDENGNYSATKSAVFRYGPYLRSIPPLMVGPRKNLTKIDSAPGQLVAWVYNPMTGEIFGNTDTEMNRAGSRLLKSY